MVATRCRMTSVVGGGDVGHLCCRCVGVRVGGLAGHAAHCSCSNVLTRGGRCGWYSGWVWERMYRCGWVLNVMHRYRCESLFLITQVELTISGAMADVGLGSSTQNCAPYSGLHCSFILKKLGAYWRLCTLHQGRVMTGDVSYNCKWLGLANSGPGTRGQQW
ncbi:hypothetical protein EJ02DRAFT_199577 [Clathrospora elynae]|uniref:Uncharacterized protein n=1 Tax=Clathrospora elynae TaxID=706981 RepID=A0A6A5T841_9PLEO|nr:hypothetical protein EJ02DRAFT_199577 [Clathrospora elynae]